MSPRKPLTAERVAMGLADSVLALAPPEAAPSLRAPMRELLTWVARRPRTYGETMAAWRSSCPRLSIWEDALDAGLVRVEAGAGIRMDEALVVLTPAGVAALDG